MPPRNSALGSGCAAIKTGVAARDHQSQAGINVPVGIGELAGVEMALEMIDGDQGDLERQCQRLGGGQPDDQGTDQSGLRRHGDGAQVAGVTPALRRASSIIGRICRTWAREAISGTTPP